MIRKGLLLKYLKKKALLGSVEFWESKRMVVKVNGEGMSKDPRISELAQNLRIVSFVGKDNEGKENKYDRCATRKEERSLRIKAIGRYVFGISKEEIFKPKTSMPIVFTNKDVATIKLPHADPLVIKLRIGDAIVSRVLVDEGSSSDLFSRMLYEEW